MLIDPEYWRQRAVTARTQAAKIIDPRVKLSLLGIADNYQEIAEQQEELLHPSLRADKPRRAVL